MEDTLIWLKVLGFGFLTDFLWTFYILFVSRRSFVLASGVSAIMALPALFGYFDMYENRVLIAPFMVGLGVGTFAGLWLHSRLEEKGYIQEG